jgi:NADH-quinone oxidoreductase subunit F
MDLKLPAAEPTAAERAAVDAVVGPRSEEPDGRAVRGGYHDAVARRHLLLPALHAVQDAIGWIRPGAAGYVAGRLGVPPADVYGVAGFYDLLATEEAPPRVALVCDDIVCRTRPGMPAGLEDVPGVRASPCLGRCETPTAALFRLVGEDDAAAGTVTADRVVAVLAGAAPPPTAPPTVGGIGDLRLLGRIGAVDPDDLDAYRNAGGYEALARALARGPDGVVAEMEAAGLRGRGGAAFPVGAKWRGTAAATAPQRYVVANADESEPGTFKDRVLMEGDPFALIEGMTVAGYAVGATRGFVYVRGEYPEAARRVGAAVGAARRAGLLGDDVAGAGFDFDVEVRRGAGAYICGEETALFNSIEGFRGEPRQKPPFPTEAGLFGAPTAVNNVETLAAVLDVLRRGAAEFRAAGTAESPGTKLFCLSGAVERPGVYEVPFGTPLRALLALCGAPDVPAAVLLGGAAGAFVAPDDLDVPLSFEGARAAGLTLGSGAVVVFDDAADMAGVVRRIAAFFRHESCGQCVPCRVGTVRQEEAVVRLVGGSDHVREAALLTDVDRAMKDASICGLGHTAGSAVASALRLGLVGGAT